MAPHAQVHGSPPPLKGNDDDADNNDDDVEIAEIDGKLTALCMFIYYIYTYIWMFIYYIVSYNIANGA